MDSSATDACLYDDDICVTHVVDTSLEIWGFEANTGYYIPAPPPSEWYFENWSREGMLHARDQHNHEFYLRFTGPPAIPNLYRRMEKRPYSGQCNLRF